MANKTIIAQLAGSIAPGKPVHTSIDRYDHHTNANARMVELRGRMPVIIDPYPTKPPSLTLAVPPHASGGANASDRFRLWGRAQY